MPLDPWTQAALITGGSSLLGSLFGANQSRQNTQDQINAALYQDSLDRQWQEHFYHRQIQNTFGTRPLGWENSVFQKGTDQELRDRDFRDFNRTAVYSLGYQKQMDESRYELERSARREDFQHLRDQGLTPQEIVGSPIGGGVSGSAPSGQVLGSATASQNAATQAASNMAMSYERGKDRTHQMRVEALRAETALRTAQIQAGTTLGSTAAKGLIDARGQDITEEGIEVNAETIKRGQDIQAETARRGQDANLKIAKDKLALEVKKYKNIELPQAANNIATSTPAWKRQELLAKMGVDNILATAMAGDFGIDPMDPDTLKSLSKEEFKELTRRIYGFSSKIYGEYSGTSLIAERQADKEGVQNFVGKTVDSAKKVVDWFNNQ